MLKKALCFSVSLILATAKEDEKEERFKDVSLGRCPHKPGTLKPFFDSDTFELENLVGPWMTLIEDKRLAGKFTCLGVRFDMISENALSVSTSNTIPE